MSFSEARGGGVCEVCPLQRFPEQDPVEGVGSVKCILYTQDFQQEGVGL